VPEQTSPAAMPASAGEPLVLDLGGPADVQEISADLAEALAGQPAGPLIMTWSHGAEAGVATPERARAVVRVGDLEVVVLRTLPDAAAPALAGMAAGGPWSGDSAVVRTVLVVADPRPAVPLPDTPTRGDTR